MAYKFSKGNRGLGDIKFEDDSDTGIDFDQDRIELQTDGQTRLRVENSEIVTTVPIHISGSNTEGLRIGKSDNDYREIQFETDGIDTAFIQVDSSEGLVIGCQSDNDEIIFMTKAGGQDMAEVARITATGRLGVGTTTPSHKLDINGDIRVRGNDIRDNSGNPAITFDGSANAAIVNDLTIGGNTFDANNKSIIKHIESGGFVKSNSNNSSVYLPEDNLASQTNANYVVLTVPPYSGSVDKLIIRGSNNTDLSDLGNIVASVRIGNQGTDGYHIDNFPDSFEDVTVTSSDLGEDKNCTFVFSNSNFTPQDVYTIRLTPTNNWNNNGNSYINFTIVTSYLID